MAYSAQTVAKARQILEGRKADKESQYRQNLLQAYREQPRLKEIDMLLRKSGLFKRLEEMGIQDGDVVDIYNFEFEYQR